MRKIKLAKKLQTAMVLTCLTAAMTVLSCDKLVWANEVANVPADTQVANAPTETNVTVPEKKEDIIGKTVVSVAITNNKLVELSEIEPIIALKAGMSLSRESVDRDIQALYESGWFYEVQPEYQLVPEGVKVTYKVLENPVFNSIEIKGNTIYKDQKLEKLVDLPKDKIINSKQLNEKVRAIEALYKQDGYILARVDDLKLGDDGKLTIVMNEGVVEGFAVKGNKKTKNYVITREMKLKIGKPFNSKEAQRSIQRLYNLGYFEDVNVKLNPAKDTNKVEVEITVAEMNTGTFGIGAGYSKSDGFVGIIALGDKNFRGTGDKANIRWEFGGGDHNKNYEFTYVKPWLDNKETSIGFSIYDLTNEYQEYFDDSSDKARYDKKRRGYEVTLSRAQSEHITNYITYKDRKDIYVKPIEGYYPQYYEMYPNSIPENFGKTRSVALTRVIDTRDNIFNPSEGKRFLVSAEFAGRMFSGDFNFNKYYAESRWYIKQGKDQVWAFKLDGGYADGTMPLSQRFALGGSETLRGYKDDQFKGYKMLAATAEFRFPVVKKVQGVIFSDTGYAWDKGQDLKLNDLKSSIGIGVRINSPLGPVRLDYGFGEEKGRFHFSFGGQF